MAPLFVAATQIRLDDRAPVNINLEPSGSTSRNSSVLWEQRGLSGSFEHSLVIQVPEDGVALVDLLVCVESTILLSFN